MAGSLVPLTNLPPLGKLLLRLLAAAALILWSASLAQSSLMRPMLPMIGAGVESWDRDVRVMDITLAREGPNQTMRVRLNLAHPVKIGGYTVRPYGSPGMPDGAIEVNLGAASLLQYSLLLLILVAACPSNNLQELGMRLVLAVPLLAAMVVVPAISTVLSLVWGPFHEELAPNVIWPILIWSRFLSGGGGLVIAILSSILTIILAKRLSGRFRA